jgi:hypothetical protein
MNKYDDVDHEAVHFVLLLIASDNLLSLVSVLNPTLEGVIFHPNYFCHHLLIMFRVWYEGL